MAEINFNPTEVLSQLTAASSANTAKSAEFAQSQADWQAEQNAKAMAFNRVEAQKNRDWQEYMSNTAHQREVKDLIAAGLNPVLSATGGSGAPVTSGATAAGVSSSGAKGEVDTSLSGGLSSLLGNLINGIMSQNVADIYGAAQMNAAATSAMAAMSAAATSANASMYAADQANYRTEKEIAYKEAYPQNPWQFASGVLNGLGYTPSDIGQTAKAAAKAYNSGATKAIQNSGVGKIVKGLENLVPSLKNTGLHDFSYNPTSHKSGKF